MRDDHRVGLVLMGHHMGYGARHGWLLGWPSWLQHLVSHIWNSVSCRLFGHQYLVQDEYGGPIECTACMRPVERYDPIHVIRGWAIFDD